MIAGLRNAATKCIGARRAPTRWYKVRGRYPLAALLIVQFKPSARRPDLRCLLFHGCICLLMGWFT
jgi:hypothetical protein